MKTQTELEIEKAGWQLIETGGGCTAYQKQLGEKIVMLTHVDGGQPPDSPDDAVLVGVYNQDGDTLALFDAPNTATVLSLNFIEHKD